MIKHQGFTSMSHWFKTSKIIFTKIDIFTSLTPSEKEIVVRTS